MRVRRWVTPFSVIILLLLSTYFETGTSAQYANSGGVALRVYHLGPKGKLEVPQGNGLTSGEPIWLEPPSGSSGPYWLTLRNEEGMPVWTYRGTLVPPENLIPVQLSPSIVPPTHTYTATLQVMTETAPMVFIGQTMVARFLLVPGFARILEEGLSRDKGSIRVQLRLLDTYDNPETGVKIGITLHQGQLAVPITSDVTDSHGRVSLHFGVALSSGHYGLEGMLASASVGLTADLIAGALGLIGAGSAVSAPFVVAGFLVASVIATVAPWGLYSTSASKISYLEGLILGPILGIPNVVIGMKNVIIPFGIGTALVAWTGFWSIVQSAWILPPPVSTPWSAGIMVLGFALYLLMAGVALSAAILGY